MINLLLSVWMKGNVVKDIIYVVFWMILIAIQRWNRYAFYVFQEKQP